MDKTFHRLKTGDNIVTKSRTTSNSKTPRKTSGGVSSATAGAPAAAATTPTGTPAEMEKKFAGLRRFASSWAFCTSCRAFS